MTSKRRQFLQSTLGLTAAFSVFSSQKAKAGTKKLPYPISCNQYTWFTFFRRAGKEWSADLDYSLGEFAKSGIEALEPSFEKPTDVERMAPLLKKYGILVPSFYVNSTLHDAGVAQQSLDTVLAIAKATQGIGAKMVVTNPSPTNWNDGRVKNAAELVEQAKNLDYLGAELRKMNLTLAYHTHDMEMKAGAREFHHMMLNTDPANVTFCMDVHWIFRGSENSELAVFDVLKLYGSRITELHIRQSKDGVWLETFQPTGDIDYNRLAVELKKRKITPHLVIEQCLEKGSPDNLTVVEAHQRDLATVKETFKGLMD